MVLRVREAITDGLHVLCRRLCIGGTDEERVASYLIANKEVIKVKIEELKLNSVEH